MQNDSSISQILLKKYDGIYAENITLIDDIRVGFSFKTGMYSLNYYKFIDEGFIKFTKNASFGKDGLLAEKMISLYYHEQGLRVFPSNVTFISYIES